MAAVSTRFGDDDQRIIISRYASIPGFTYEDGYTFSATDLANRGVKIDLAHEHDRSAAIILPPEKVAECGRWLLQTLGQDRHGLPNGLSDILRRLSKLTPNASILERGDKTRIREALRVLGQ